MGIIFTSLFSILGILICIASAPGPSIHKRIIHNNQAFIQTAQMEEQLEQLEELERGAGVLGSLPHRIEAEQYEASAGDILGSVSKMYGIG